jgi:CheY-like chemotaxis protein
MSIRGILVVEDDFIARFLVEGTLVNANVTDRVAFASNGKEALDFLEKAASNSGDAFIPEVIFLDLHMPIMDGEQFLEHYESTYAERLKCRVYPFIFSMKETERFARWNHIISAFIEKPLTVEKIKEIAGSN